MKRFPLLVVAAFLSVAVSVPAQFSDSFSGQSNRSTVSAGSQSERGPATRHSGRGGRVSQSARSSSRARVVGAVPVRRVPASASRARVSGGSQLSRVSRYGEVTQSRRRGHSAVRSVARSLGRVVVGVPSQNCQIIDRGRWELRCERVLVPGYWDVQCHLARYGWVYDLCGQRSWGVVEPAYQQRIWVPTRYENRSRRVWVRY
jgi:hypothetical protein